MIRPRGGSGVTAELLAQPLGLARPAEVDDLDQAELPAAVGAVGQPDRGGLVHLEPRAGRLPCDPEHVATMQAGANRNWQAIGMEVPKALRDLEDPARHQRLADEEYSMPLNRGVGA